MPSLSTDDLGIAAFMRARGARLVDITGAGHRLTLHFESSDPSLIEQYHAASTVPAIALMQSLHFLRVAVGKARGAARSAGGRA